MKWYIVIRIFFVPYAEIGPYETQEQCVEQPAAYTAEYRGRYDSGERLEFLGKTINPYNVKASCKLK